jgi:hypothetical protein
MAAFSNATSEALDAKVDHVCNELAKNPALMHTIAGLMRKDTLVALLDGTLGDKDTQQPQTESVWSNRKMRSAITKFAHLGGVKGFVAESLCTIEPNHFKRESFEAEWSNEDIIGILCFALRVRRDSALPTKSHEVELLGDLVSAFSQRYASVGKPMENVSKNAILNGYYLSQDLRILCSLAPPPQEGEEPLHIEFSWADSLVLEDAFDADSAVSLHRGGRKMSFTALRSTFEQKGVNFRVDGDTWTLAGYPLRQPLTPQGGGTAVTTPDRRQRTPGARGSTPEGRTTPRADNDVSNVLRNRLNATPSRESPRPT